MMAEAEKEPPLVSMKRPKKGAADSEYGLPGPSDMAAPEYGHGLQINLENFELDKLGMKGMPPGVGTQFQLEAKVVVTRASMSQSANNQGDRSACLQITAMSLQPASADKD